MKEFKEDKGGELENNQRFLAAKHLLLERPGSIYKEINLTRKYMKEIDALETKIIWIERVMIGTLNYDCNRVLIDLDFKQKSILERVKLIETQLKGKCH